MAAKKANGTVVKHALRREDKILWEAVKRTIREFNATRSGEPRFETLDCTPAPIKPCLNSLIVNEPSKTSFRTQSVSAQAIRPKSHPKVPSQMPKLDKATHRKIAKGRVRIDGRVDLHGLTQDQAYTLLLRFIFDAQRNGSRFVLVITGKGSSSGSEGVLKQSVPHWLATPPLRLCVSGFEDAGLSHGGTGALYVRIRRNTIA